MAGLDAYVLLTDEDARRQWRRVLQRRAPTKGKRQESFLPVETLVCFSLFFEVRPNRYGGANMHTAPKVVHQLAGLFRRSPGSVLYKMANLNLSLAHGGAFEAELYQRLIADDDLHWRLYRRVLHAAREVGITTADLPDFLGLLATPELDLLGQDELVGLDLPHLLADEVEELEKRLGTSTAATARIVERRARVGQHRFAKQVLANYAHRCGFCGLNASGLPGHKLLVASHIKPWRDSTGSERLDVRNGVAACPTHDAAFDTGLLTVNGGLTIHRAHDLNAVLAAEPTMQSHFGWRTHVLERHLLVPQGATRPGATYLAHHKQHIFRGP